MRNSLLSAGHTVTRGGGCQSNMRGCRKYNPRQACDTVAVYEEEARLLANDLLGVMQTIRRLKRGLKPLFLEHPDQNIFASLPEQGIYWRHRCWPSLAMTGRGFPRPAACKHWPERVPVTDQSGQKRIVKFRRACDIEFRQIVQQWARCSLRRSAGPMHTGWKSAVEVMAIMMRIVDWPIVGWRYVEAVADKGGL